MIDETIQLILDDVLSFHSNMIEEFKNAEGIRDQGMLESAINTPFQCCFGQDLYPSIYDKAARMCFGLINNHPFVDGNKRTGIHAMLVFLYINQRDIDYTQLEIENVAIAIAEKKMTIEELAIWLKEKAYIISFDENDEVLDRRKEE